MADANNARELPIKIVKCFGIIPVRFQDGFFELFIIQQRAGHWGFPKGHPEPQDKSEYESACREMKEECNLEVKRVLFEDTFTDKYHYVKKGCQDNKFNINDEYTSIKVKSTKFGFVSNRRILLTVQQSATH